MFLQGRQVVERVDWARSAEGIWVLPAAVAGARWVGRQYHPGSNGQRRCCGTGRGTEGTG